MSASSYILTDTLFHDEGRVDQFHWIVILWGKSLPFLLITSTSIKPVFFGRLSLWHPSSKSFPILQMVRLAVAILTAVHPKAMVIYFLEAPIAK